MWLTSLLRSVNRGRHPQAQRNPAPQRRSSGRCRLLVEALEDRCLLSTSISGTAFEDLTANGLSPDDSSLVGRSINLFRDNGDGTFDPGSDAFAGQQRTDRNGHYDFRSLPAGTYFVQQVLPLDWVQTAPAEERIDEVLQPADCGPAPRERNETLVTAVATGLSSAAPGRYTARGEIGDNNYHELDVDLFRVQVNAGDMIRVDVDAEAFDSSLDGTLRLFDAAGLQVACSTDVGDSSDPYLEVIAKATGTYYVGVSGHANADYDPAVAGSGSLGLLHGRIHARDRSRPATGGTARRRHAGLRGDTHRRRPGQLAPRIDHRPDVRRPRWRRRTRTATNQVWTAGACCSCTREACSASPQPAAST